MSPSLLEATLFTCPSEHCWPRCPPCSGSPLQLCVECARSYASDVGDRLCNACVSVNADLASHRQRHSEVLGLCLDDGICDLVEELAAFGAPTVGSCAGSPPVALGRPYVAFETVGDVESVLRAALAAASDADDHDRDARIMGLPTQPVLERWAVTMVAIDGSDGLTLCPHLDLPQKDVPWLAEALRDPGRPEG